MCGRDSTKVCGSSKKRAIGVFLTSSYSKTPGHVTGNALWRRLSTFVFSVEDVEVSTDMRGFVVVNTNLPTL